MAKGRGSGAVWLCAAVLLHCRNAKPARPFSGMEFLSPSNAPGEMPPGTRAASLGPGTHHSSVSFSLEISLEMPLLLLLPVVLGCGCAPSSGAGHVGVGISPKQPQNSSHCSLHTRAAHRKMGEYSSMRVMSFQGQKVADEFALSAWRRSCDITQKFKNTEFLGGSHPPGQGSSPTVFLTFTGARHRLCYGTAGKAAPHPQLS